ncbi:glucans biosynthesis protein [mine drainage metagenome]|uniref:Glucans biosynthesis protein n=1 Tax=mine drainage metagenome TaxID=410659 RepID=A0A1J5S3Y6_9ZZZZ
MQIKSRFIELDGLRGLAAFSVFLGHSIGMMKGTEAIDALYASPFHILWDGAGAVDLFFVLSGFVLALPYFYKVENPKYLQFCIRRAFRLYPAFWLALVLSLALRVWGYNPSGLEALSDWSRSMWTSNVTIDLFLRSMSLLLGVDTRQIDPVVWTLIIEMRMSIVLPVIIVALNYSRNAFFDLVIFAMCIVLGGVIDVLAYLPLFALGAVTAKHHAALHLKISDMKLFWWLGILCMGIMLYGNRWIVPELSHFQQDIGSGLGSAIIILCTLASPVLSGALSKPVLHFMGYTSYSFYLLHLPLLLFVTSYLFPLTNSTLLCTVIVLVFAYVLAYLAFQFIEQPINKFGRDATINFNH